ncbi:protoheme IX farnesyltransferase [Rickettsia typhi str. B9991CWPP]|uniref:Protoheme IX farnesyltransferase n=1 Tax=Rickettsia typhi str. TH1527 TaxID=1003201 RepID=A0ABM5MW08_RICTP|nr:protoheme IX farnesyltransferase [Rickettsia typhi]AFE54193.1 protoheme IX farnesyltransferase [Rickettsia typhi str. TH1527]AFE55033.1 protoheme IX farnesyltransferase [Rickettsia typhi str. B9991CWPP]
MKPHVMFLVIFTGFVGIWLAPDSINPLIAITMYSSLGVGSVGAMNM